MNVSKLIYQTLSPIVSGRVYPNRVPETAADAVASKPYIIYTRAASTPETSQDGYEGHEYVNMQIDVYTYLYTDTENLMAVVINALAAIGADIGTRQSIPDPNPKLDRQTLDIHIWGTTF